MFARAALGNDRSQTASVLLVLCSDSELDEYGEVLRVGDHVRRMAARREAGVYFGTELDAVEWQFDRYADILGRESVTISGTTTAIHAVFVLLTKSPEGWTARPGSARLEPLSTTAATRKPVEVIDWEPPTPPDDRGRSFRRGHRRIEEGTEQLTGWVVTLSEPRIERRITQP